MDLSYFSATLAQNKQSWGAPFLLFLGLLTACSSKNVETTPKTQQNEAAGATELQASYEGFGSNSVSPELLQKFKAAPVAPEILSEIQSLLDIRSPGYGLTDSKGERLFFTWNVTGTRQVWRVEGPKTFPIQMTGGQDSVSLRGISPDDKWLVLQRDKDGDEQFGIYLQATTGGPLREVFKRDKVVASFDFISEDSRYLYFRANLHSPSSFTLFHYDIEQRLTEEVVRLEGFWNVSDFQSDGRILLREAKGNIHSAYYEWRPQTKELIPLFGQNETESYYASYSAQDDELLVMTNRFGEFYQMYRWNRDREDFTPLLEERDTELSYFLVDETRSKLVLSLNDKGYTRFEVYRLPEMQEVEIDWSNFQVEHRIPGTLSRGGKYLSTMLASSFEPSRTAVLNLETSEVKLWLEGNVPEIKTDFAEPASLEFYSARDGTQIPMFVQRPKQCKESLCPVVVDFHGGPESQAVPYFSATPLMFLKRGFVYVQPNVRGSSGYGKSWIDSDNAEKRLQVITDIEDAALFIKENWKVNGQAPAVGVMGGSYGGYSTKMAMTRFAGAYDAGVSIVGMTSLLTFLENTAPYRRALRVSEYGNPETQRETLLQLSPITYRDQIEAPLMIIHGATDPRVPVGEAILMYDAMTERGIKAPLIIFPDEGHGVRKRENQALMLAHILDFFEQNLRAANSAERQN